MAQLPRGTVTFAFTDIEGSTALLKTLGESYGDLLSQHRRLVREVFVRHDGLEIDTQGDAFFFVFIRARDAVAASAEIQQAHTTAVWPQNAEVRMRVGLHTGEPSVGEEGYLGIDVVRAARLCASGRGGQVLLSSTTRALLGSNLPEGVSVFPLGERHLKDIDHPEEVYELEVEGASVGAPESQDSSTVSPSSTSTDDDSSWEEQLDQRITAMTQNAITSALDKIESKLAGSKGSDDGSDAEGLDKIAGGGNELVRGIKAAIDEALRSGG